MWYSLFDYLPQISSFATFLGQKPNVKLGDISIHRTGACSQFVFAFNKTKKMILSVRPRFKERQMHVSVFSDLVSHGTPKNLYHADKGAFFESDYKHYCKIIALFMDWLHFVGFDGFVVCHALNEPALQSFASMYGAEGRLIPVGKESDHITMLMNRLDLTSVYHCDRYKSCLKERVFDHSSMLVRHTFYPKPAVIFTHFPGDMYNTPDVEDYFEFRRCETQEDMEAFLADLTSYDKEWNDLITKRKEVTEESEGYSIGINMDHFYPRFHTYTGRIDPEFYFDNKDDALNFLKHHHESKKKLVHVSAKLAVLIHLQDETADVQKDFIQLFGHRVPCSISMFITPDRLIKFLFKFSSDEDQIFDDTDSLLAGIEARLLVFAKKHRLPFLLG
jgi:hypothetical protein